MPELDELQMKARVGEILNRWPAVGLAVGVVRDGSLESFCGHGLADVASNTPITEDTVFRIASMMEPRKTHVGVRRRGASGGSVG